MKRSHPVGIRARLGLLSAGLTTIAVLLASCATTYEPTAVPAAPESTQPTAGGKPAEPAECDNPVASYQPSGSIPKANQMPAGSSMKKIQDRGRLIAGISADTYLLGSRNPLTGKIEGFDIDVVKEIAKAIFGDETKYELRVITAADRIPVLEDNSVDVVVRAMTITCDRWTKIAFSTEYYHAGQKTLVRKGSKAKSLQDLAGQKVCAPNSTTTMDNLIKIAPEAIPVGAVDNAGCLTLFQQGDVDAITGDDTILAGLAAQDPYAEVLDEKPITAEPYGIGISQSNPDLVRFVNQRLEQLRTSGEWTTIYNTWLAEPLGKAPAPPKAVYGRTP